MSGHVFKGEMSASPGNHQTLLCGELCVHTVTFKFPFSSFISSLLYIYIYTLVIIIIIMFRGYTCKAIGNVAIV